MSVLLSDCNQLLNLMKVIYVVLTSESITKLQLVHFLLYANLVHRQQLLLCICFLLFKCCLNISCTHVTHTKEICGCRLKSIIISIISIIIEFSLSVDSKNMVTDS